MATTALPTPPDHNHVAAAISDDGNTLKLSGSSTSVTVTYENSVVSFYKTKHPGDTYSELGWTVDTAPTAPTTAVAFTFGTGVSSLSSNSSYISFEAKSGGAKASVTSPNAVGSYDCSFSVGTTSGENAEVDPIIVITVKP